MSRKRELAFEDALELGDVIEAFDAVDYRGYLTFEYFHPYAHYPEALIHQTSDSLDRMLGRKV